MDVPMDAVAGILVFVVVAVVALSVSTWLHRRKVAALTEWARQRGWQYTEKRPDLVNRFSGAPFGRGRGRRVQHVLSGTHRGHRVLAFEYRYTTRSGSGEDSSSRTHHHQITAIPLPAARPTLEVSREHFGHKLLEFVGIHDLRLPNERFNAAFRIRTENDQFAHDVLHPHMTEWMLTDERIRNLTLRFNGDHLLAWQRGKFDSDNAARAADYLIDVLERVPAHVWAQAPRM
ncbi:type III secretion system chaperone family protein [Allosalinactinospora lopnorensis]|uniref:hypothetical protein n=1 Tax=Allosalinactinospora lopnorensis TaxID=1352348 RepID=UPI0006961724|nr:hypothetical protein [Allosalinactinospora lopnorensis]